MGLVRNDPRYADYRPLLDDEARLRAHVAYRDRVFLPVRPLDYYLRCLEGAGFCIEEVSAPRTTVVRLPDVTGTDWTAFTPTGTLAASGRRLSRMDASAIRLWDELTGPLHSFAGRSLLYERPNFSGDTSERYASRCRAISSGATSCLRAWITSAGASSKMTTSGLAATRQIARSSHSGPA